MRHELFGNRDLEHFSDSAETARAWTGQVGHDLHSGQLTDDFADQSGLGRAIRRNAAGGQAANGVIG